VHALSPDVTSPAEAKKDAAMWLERLARKTAENYDWT
jgi:hypothetical protein